MKSFVVWGAALKRERFSTTNWVDERYKLPELRRIAFAPDPRPRNQKRPHWRVMYPSSDSADRDCSPHDVPVTCIRRD